MKRILSYLLISLLCLTPFSWASEDKVMVQVVFHENVKVHGQTIPYSDAFYFTQDEYAAMTPEELAAKKKERVDNWTAMLNAPPVELTKEEELAQVETEIAQMEEQKVQWESRKVELTSKLATLSAISISEEPLEIKK